MAAADSEGAGEADTEALPEEVRDVEMLRVGEERGDLEVEAEPDALAEREGVEVRDTSGDTLAVKLPVPLLWGVGDPVPEATALAVKVREGDAEWEPDTVPVLDSSALRLPEPLTAAVAEGRGEAEPVAELVKLPVGALVRVGVSVG